MNVLALLDHMTWWVATEESGGGRFAAPSMAAAERSVTSGGGALQIALSLIIVLVTIFVVAWVAKRMRVTPSSRAGLVKVVDEVGIGPKERAVIIDAEGTRLVIGVGEGRVVLLHRYAAPPGTENTPLVETAASPSFVDVLKRGLGK
jgi:flagellar protein FliO/FliZ